MSSSWIVLLVLAASSGETSPPPSETAKTTAVVGMNGCAAETVTPVVRAFREAMMLRLGDRVQSEVETARPLGGLGARSLADIERMLAGARVDVFQEAYDRAQRTLEGALEELGRVPPSVARWEDEREVATTLGFLFFVTGRRGEAEKVLRQPLIVEPGFRPNPELYPPSFRTFVQSLSGRQQREGASRMDIATHPQGIVVYVAGRPMGKGPLSLRLPPGSYRVEGDFAGGRGLARTVTVPPRGEKGEALALELREDFDGAMHADAGPCVEAGPERKRRLNSLVRLGSLLGVGSVVAVSQEQPTRGERYLIVTAVDVVTGEETREAKVKQYSGLATPQVLGNLADFVATGNAVPPVEAMKGAAAPAPVVSKLPLVPEKERDEKPYFTKSRLKTFTYVSGGVALVSLGASGFFALKANSASKDLEKLGPDGRFPPGSELRYAELTEALNSNRSRAIVIGVVGGVALAATATFYLLSRGAPPVDLASAASGAEGAWVQPGVFHF